MFTNVEKAITMATEIGMSGLFLDAVGLVTEVMEYFRSALKEEIITVACMRPDDPVLSRPYGEFMLHVVIDHTFVWKTEIHFLYSMLVFLIFFDIR